MGQVSENSQRKKESFSLMIINYDSVLADVAEYMRWIRLKEAEMSEVPCVGLNVEQARSALARHDVSRYFDIDLCYKVKM